MPALVMLSPAPVIETPGGEVILDTGFVEGMKLHCQLWPGRVCCVLRRGAGAISEGMRYHPSRLGFDLLVLDPTETLPEVLLDEASLVYCALDDMTYLDLHRRMTGRLARLVHTVEQPLAGRITDALAHPSLRRRIGGVLWNLRREGRFRHALSNAAGAHFNGFPAWDSYRRLNARAIVYLDNRLRAPLQARRLELEQRVERLSSGKPLRLVSFGPLTAETGVEDLLPMASLLAGRGVEFTLDIFGSGPLGARLIGGFAALGLKDRVRVRGAVGFDASLVPYLRREADLMLAPRRLSTPAPQYIEAMGCGLAVAGYGNAMWKALFERSGGGFVCASRPGAMAGLVAALDADRSALARACEKALSFARDHSFESVFAARMTDLRRIAGLEDDT